MNTTPQAAPTLPLLMGLPDVRQVPVTGVVNGVPTYGMVGNARIATHLSAQVKQRMVRVFCGPDLPVRLPPGLQRSPMLNAIGDPDICNVALRTLVEHLAQTGAPCFNHPLAVLESGRDSVAAKLAGIPGLHVPRTVKLRIEEPADIVNAAEREGLAWPLIVRVAGSHVGKDTVRIENPGEVRSSLRDLPWGGRNLYLTEFVEYKDDDGLYRKMRMMAIGAEVFMRHHIVSRHWMIHAADRPPGGEEAETALVREFNATRPPHLRETMLKVAEKMGMDYVGMDCSLRPDGRLLVFEVNAMMDSMEITAPTTQGGIEASNMMKRAIGELMFAPTRWRRSRRIQSEAAATTEPSSHE